MRFIQSMSSVSFDKMSMLNDAKLSRHCLSRGLGMGMMLAFLVGCQSMSTSPTTPNTPTQTVSDIQQLTPVKLDKFAVLGKIGVVNTSDNQAGSAFYAWGQDQERFSIELQGALGVGLTTIEYNGNTAVLNNASLGTIAAPTPEALLLQATNWQAPISQLPYWLSGSPAPSDTAQYQDEHGRLIQAVNGEWTASFNYSNDVRLDGHPYALPNQITAIHSNGSKATISIRHR